MTSIMLLMLYARAPRLFAVPHALLRHLPHVLVVLPLSEQVQATSSSQTGAEKQVF